MTRIATSNEFKTRDNRWEVTADVNVQLRSLLPPTISREKIDQVERRIALFIAEDIEILLSKFDDDG